MRGITFLKEINYIFSKKKNHIIFYFLSNFKKKKEKEKKRKKATTWILWLADHPNSRSREWPGHHLLASGVIVTTLGVPRGWLRQRTSIHVQGLFIFIRVKHFFGTCSFKFLFFAPCPSIRITNIIWAMGKDEVGTSVQKLMVVHVATLRCWHVSYELKN